MIRGGEKAASAEVVNVVPAAVTPPTPREVALRYLGAIRALLSQVDLDALDRMVETLRDARNRGATIFVAGNGGSAATASHLVNDLAKATKTDGLPPIRVIGLADNTSWLTALANDEGYERVFSGQLENFATPGDVLLVISASGNSPNLVSAVELARARGVNTLALLGFDGGVLKTAVDNCLWLPCRRGLYGLVESAHSILCDILATCLMNPDVVAGIADVLPREPPGASP
jgi:D-sedoheptulose 7-phosphate isomerase